MTISWGGREGIGRTKSYQMKYILSWKILSYLYLKFIFNELLYLGHKNKIKKFLKWLVKSTSKYSGISQYSLKSRDLLSLFKPKISCLTHNLFICSSFIFMIFFQLFLKRGWRIMFIALTTHPSSLLTSGAI